MSVQIKTKKKKKKNTSSKNKKKKNQENILEEEDKKWWEEEPEMQAPPDYNDEDYYYDEYYDDYYGGYGYEEQYSAAIIPKQSKSMIGGAKSVKKMKGGGPKPRFPQDNGKVRKLLERNDRIGFIIVDPYVCLFGTVSNKKKSVLYKYGTRPLKNQRVQVKENIILESKKKNYFKRIDDLSVKYFFNENGNKIKIKGLIVGGPGIFKTELVNGNFLNSQLNAVLLKTLDLQYGEEKGFTTAINLTKQFLFQAKTERESILFNKFKEEIGKDSKKFVFGVANTFQALRSGAILTLILSSNLQVYRFEVFEQNNNQSKEYFLTEHDKSVLVKKKSLQFVYKSGKKKKFDKKSVLEWIAENYTKYGCQVEIISDDYEEGRTFLQTYGGIGGILRYPINFQQINFLDDYYEKNK